MIGAYGPIVPVPQAWASRPFAGLRLGENGLSVAMPFFGYFASAGSASPRRPGPNLRPRPAREITLCRDVVLCKFRLLDVLGDAKNGIGKLDVESWLERERA